MSIADWIQSTCAVLAVLLTLYNLEPERRARLRETVRALTSRVITASLYLPLIAIIVLFGSEIVDFSHGEAPIQRYEVINLLCNVLSVGAAVWACIFLYGNAGRGTKKAA